MKRVFLIRHAKSSWEDLTLSDFDRPLNNRGLKTVPIMANVLKQKNIKPDLILSSTALRAKTTAIMMAKLLDISSIQFENRLYDPSKSDLMNCLKELDESNKTVFLFGHNPTLNSVAYDLIGFIENIPTCAVLEIEFSTSLWKDISKKNAHFVSFEYPKKYN